MDASRFDAQVETAMRQLGELIRACEQDFTSDDTETGDFACLDDDTVAAGDTPTVLTFGDIRNARLSLEFIREKLGLRSETA